MNDAVVDVNHAAVMCHTQRCEHAVPCTADQLSPTHLSKTLLQASLGWLAPSVFFVHLSEKRTVRIGWHRLFMAALRSRCGHYIFVPWLLSSSLFFFFRLMSAVADWMSTISVCTGLFIRGAFENVCLKGAL